MQRSEPVAMLRRLLYDRAWQFQFGRYLTIGGVVFCVDFGLFALLVRSGVLLAVATTVAYGIGICTHFTLNKFANFRAHDRSIHRQAVTYGVVAGISYLTTLVVIEACVLAFGMSPYVSKLVAVAVNLPIGFAGHRYLTFGAGIGSTLRRLFARTADL